jgi:hypothetical protein
MAVAEAAWRLEDDLDRGVRTGIEPEPCPRAGTRLAFYITSLSKPHTDRDAAAQLKVALPLNLLLALHSRKWATFYVSRSELLAEVKFLVVIYPRSGSSAPVLGLNNARPAPQNLNI